MGDIVLITPVLRWIKTRFPDAQLDVLVKSKFASLLENQPEVNRVLTVSREKDGIFYSRVRHEIKNRGYDAVVDLQASPLSRRLARSSRAKRIALHQPQRWARFWLVNFGLNSYKDIQPIPQRYLKAVQFWGVQDDEKGAMLHPKDSDIQKAQTYLSGLHSEKIVVLAPGAGRKTKRWPARYYQEVGRHFHDGGYAIVLVGGMDVRENCDEVLQNLPHGSLDLCGDLALMETAALLKMARIVVSNDTGVMHIAGAVGAPVVAIFGPTTEHLGFFPFRSNSIVVEHPDLKCRPCSFHGTDKCPQKHFRCMKEIYPERVIEAMEMLLGGCIVVE